MSTDYNYDEQGQFFPYFVVIITSLFTLPATYSVLRPSKELENTGSRIQSDFRPEHEDLITKSKWKQKRRERKVKRMAVAIIGWTVMAWMVYLMITTQRLTPKIWDPYEILGLSRSADERQIKKHFRKMSIRDHPDKRTPDPAKNETTQTVNDHWVEITKAFKTLTDEEIRNNYIQYGHPDGKQSFSIGIALPQFIITEGNGKYVLLLYAALLGVMLPLLVGRWWYGTQSMTRDGILVESAGKLFTEYNEDIDEGGVIRALSRGVEYENRIGLNKEEEDSGKVERRLVSATENSKAGFTTSDRTRLLQMSDEPRRKILSLLWAYLHRVELNDPSSNEQKYEVAPIAFSLNEALISMCLAYGNTSPLLASLHAAQGIMQAVPPTASPLLQLPHFTPAVITAIEDLSKDPDLTRSLDAFLSLTDAKRRAITTTSSGNPILTSFQYATAMRVAAQLPAARVERAFFKVIGERKVTTGSLIQFVIKLRIIPPGTDASTIPAVAAQDLEDPDPKEGDLDALHGRSSRTKAGGNLGKAQAGKADNDEERVQPPLAHAPYFARDHSPRWRVFLADSKQGKIAVPPFTFSTFDAPFFDPASAPAPKTPLSATFAGASSATSTTALETPKPTFAVQTLKMQFQAPPQAGKYPFTMHLVCDSYRGLDTAMDVVMDVREAEEAEELDSDGDISEPDEDSIAGQMNALRSGGGGGGGDGAANKPKPKRRPVRAAEVDEDEASSDDESGTDEERSDSSDTDTDTDTDED